MHSLRSDPRPPSGAAVWIDLPGKAHSQGTVVRSTPATSQCAIRRCCASTCNAPADASCRKSRRISEAWRAGSSTASKTFCTRAATRRVAHSRNNPLIIWRPSLTAGSACLPCSSVDCRSALSHRHIALRRHRPSKTSLFPRGKRLSVCSWQVLRTMRSSCSILGGS